jgi:hypothetical protein
MDTGELLLEVEPGGAAARVVDRTTLGDAGLLERRHLQEWIVAHPEILGPTVMVVTIEYAGWIVDGDPQRQRLDVLGIDADGRLVVAELKRGLAPDTVDMQAVKYAAMASRFSLETLAAAHATFCKSRGVTLSEDQAAEALQAHAAALSDDTLNDPRIVIVAQGYSPLVISTVVWLADRGVDISLVQFQPYKRSTGEVLVTFSTLFPLPDLERSLISPGEAAAEVPTNKLPFVEWTTEDLVKLGQIANLTTRSTLDLCSEQPGVPVSLTRVVDAASVTRFAARAQLAGLTQIVKRRFGRRNWPFTVEWDVDGSGQQFYVITGEVATRWHAAAIELDTEQSEVVDDALSDGSSPFTTGEDTVVPN